MTEEKAKPKGLLGRLFGSKETPAAPADAPDEQAGKEVEETAEAAPHAVAAPGGDEDPLPTANPAPVPAARQDSPPPAVKKGGWLQRLRDGLSKTSTKLSSGITGLFTKRKLDGATLEDLEDLLIEADLGVETATRITAAISQGRYEKGISADEVRDILAGEVRRVLEPVAKPFRVNAALKPHVILVVGVNGSGKTTTIGKLAAQFAGEGRKVMMAAGDTFRAAAIDQLKVWGERTGAKVMSREVGADASGLVFDAVKAARDESCDVLLVDTAGRLQNKQALMEELEKVIRVMRKVDPTAPHDVLLVLDATTGQNAMSQVEVFSKRAGVTGLVMTKLDGTARGGILVAIAAKHAIPVHAIGVGESVEDLQAFDAGDFAKAIAQS